jgi:pyruvate-ferredoxin/flavodoxin oxidoreductase
LATRKISLYTIDAVKIAEEIGLGGRINMIMQTVFFKLSKVLEVEEAISFLKKAIQKAYGAKGKDVVKMNFDAVDKTLENLVKVEVPDSWKDAPLEEIVYGDEPEWVTKVMRPILLQKGDDVPVSEFASPLDGTYRWTGPDGTFPVDTAQYEKRGIAINVPEWNDETCTMCNHCAFVCPHGVLRPVLLTEEEAAKAPKTFKTKDAKGKTLQGMKFRMQVSILDCTGCGNCADICPVNTGGKSDPALVMKPLHTQTEEQVPNAQFADTVPPKTDVLEKTTLTGSQYQEILFEFSGACGGCGETPYYKLVTQLFGDRMLVGNATGCSSIYGGSAPSCPFAVNRKGHGPAWANSLFEDNAEYAFGMVLATDQRRDRVADKVREALKKGVSSDLKSAMEEWLSSMHDAEKSREAGNRMADILLKEAKGNALLTEILGMRDLFTKKSIWAVGGDGWAYDIGFGGLDHVLAMNQDINILVLDTEVYSNTGGQSSKSTPTGSVAKFATSGKKTMKKDLGAMAMTYGYVYVASVAMGANKVQCLKAFLEAESYPGPSLIIAYSPCINHGIRKGMGKSQEEEKLAVECGYWSLYRNDPRLTQQGKNPFQLDSKEPKSDIREFLRGEVRYASLETTFPEEAKVLHARLANEVRDRWEKYKRMAAAEVCYTETAAK